MMIVIMIVKLTITAQTFEVLSQLYPIKLYIYDRLFDVINVGLVLIF